ncbi:MAG: beta strand repeat-containing protein, partial [Verrucomicrobiota bacterium]
GTNVINGGGAGGAFVLASGASLISGNTNGLVNGALGTIYNFSTTTLPTDANYTFNGAANQITLGLPAAVANFTNSNTGGLLALSAGLAVTGSATVEAGATLNFNGHNVTDSGGASVFTVADGGGLQITDPSGITTAGASGNVQTALRSYSQAGNYTYAGSAAQAVGNGLPATVNALTDLNTGGTVTLAQQTTVATVTTLAAGANLSLPTGTTSTSAALVIGGTQQAAGTWGNTGSGAAHIDASHFAGSGVLSAGSTIVSTIYGGLWNTPTTWSGGVVPGSSDDVMIATFGNANAVALDGTNAIHSLTINSGARFSMSSIGLSEQLTINGNLANNGSFVRVGGTPALGNLLVFNGSSSVWTGSGNLSANKIGFTVNAGKSLDISGLSSGVVLQGGYLFVTVNGTLIAGTQVINGNLQTSPTFTLAAGGTLVSANVNGLLNGDQGTIYNFNAVNLSSAANYVFNGAADQNTYGLPATINSLTDNNTAGTVTVNQQMTIAGGVTLANGAVLSLPGGTTSTAGSLGIGGVVQLPGTWGDASSGATHIDSTHFTGGGVLSVANGPADAAHSTISPATAFILPNGLSTQVITVQARDASGNKVTVGGSTVVISRSSGAGTIGGTTDNGNGTYTATVTSPLSAGSGTFTATLDGVAVGTAVGASSSLLTYTSQLVVSTSTGGAWSAPTTWAGGAVPTTSDNVVIATTGSSSVYLDVSTTVNSLIINSGAQFSMSSAAVNQTLGLNGNLNNNGSIIRVGGTPATASAIYFNGTPSVWTGSGNLSSNKVSITVNPGKTLDISGLSSPISLFNGTLAFTVNGTLIAGTQVISGYNTLANNIFTLAAGGTLVSANLNGITNNSSCTLYNFKTVNLSSAGNYIFNGAAAQATLGLPATVNSLTDNNTGGILTIGQQTTVAGGVTVAAGARLSLPAGTTSTAAALVMGGSIGAVGTWGNTGSGDAHIDSNFFAGTGQLSVAGSPDAAHSTITPAHAFILSDGTSTQLITVQVRDVNG